MPSLLVTVTPCRRGPEWLLPPGHLCAPICHSKLSLQVHWEPNGSSRCSGAEANDCCQPCPHLSGSHSPLPPGPVPVATLGFAEPQGSCWACCVLGFWGKCRGGTAATRTPCLLKGKSSPSSSLHVPLPRGGFWFKSRGCFRRWKFKIEKVKFMCVWCGRALCSSLGILETSLLFSLLSLTDCCQPQCFRVIQDGSAGTRLAEHGQDVWSLEEGLDSWPRPVGTLSTVSVQGWTCVNRNHLHFSYWGV